MLIGFQVPAPSEDAASSSNFAPGAEGYHFGRQTGVGPLSGLAQQQTGKVKSRRARKRQDGARGLAASTANSSWALENVRPPANPMPLAEQPFSQTCRLFCTETGFHARPVPLQTDTVTGDVIIGDTKGHLDVSREQTTGTGGAIPDVTNLSMTPALRLRRVHVMAKSTRSEKMAMSSDPKSNSAGSSRSRNALNPAPARQSTLSQSPCACLLDFPTEY
jgi:hypothetical protein